MKCNQARRLFGAYWDDEASLAEREWLEAHLGECGACRREYEEFSRALEAAGTLPRLEAAPDLVERVLARSRRAPAAPDRIPRPKVRWVPITAAASLVVLAITATAPWIGRGPMAPGRGTTALAPVREPVLVQPRAVSGRTGTAADAAVAGIPDSLFDHSEDVEFILDPVTLRRGRASLSHAPASVQGEQAVVTF